MQKVILANANTILLTKSFAKECRGKQFALNELVIKLLRENNLLNTVYVSLHIYDEEKKWQGQIPIV